MILYSYLLDRVGEDVFSWVSFVSELVVVRILQHNLDAVGSLGQQSASITPAFFFLVIFFCCNCR